MCNNLSDNDLVHALKQAREQLDHWKIERQAYEEELQKRLEEREARGEKASIETLDGLKVHLEDPKPYFSYDDQTLDQTHEWLANNNLQGLLKPPKVHYQTFNKVMRDRVEQGQEIPSWIKVTTDRKLLTRGMGS